MKKVKIHEVQDYGVGPPEQAAKGGFLVEAKVFPPSKPGGVGPEFDPSASAPPCPEPSPEDPELQKKQFKDCLNHYLSLIHHYVSQLNGLQFDYEPPASAGAADVCLVKFKDVLKKFSDALEIGSTGVTITPGYLRWPLAGIYQITKNRLNGGNVEDARDRLVLTLFFECEPDYYMVPNASVQLQWEHSASPWISSSSSSSYLATSSSSHP